MTQQQRVATPLAFTGNAHALDALRATLRADRLPHALLVTGPPQVGKGALARRLAQALLCEQRGPGEADPCGECRACVRVEHGTHPDAQVYGLARQARQSDKAAPSREVGIDAARELVAEIGLLPFEGGRKVYIVEDAGTLTDEAANALLKTLEEPPAYAVLILLGEDERTLPETIRSRCTPVRLGAVAEAEIRVLLLTQPGVTPEQAERLAALAAGRPGWALDAVRDPAVLERLDANVGALVEALGGGAVAKLALAERMAKRWSGGHRPEVYGALFDWLGYWRFVLHRAAGAGGADQFPAHRETTERLAARGVEAASRAASRTVEAISHLDANANTRMTIETLLLEVV